MSRVVRRIGAALIATVAAASMAACSDNGGGGGGSGSGGLGKEVKVLSLRQLTGISSFAGTNGKKGSDLALQEINDQKFLGDKTKLVFDTKDVGQTTQQAASYASQGVADKSYSIVFGPEASAQAAAVSAITQKSKMPTVYIQAGSSSVMAGDYIYRVTAPVYSYFDVAGKYMQSKGLKTASVIYSSENPTLTQLGKETIPGMASKYGFTVKSTDTTTNTANDFTAFATKMASSQPAAVFLMLQGGQDPVAITQLKRAGYKGEFISMSAMGAGNLKPAGETAKGAVWATDFTASQPGDTTQKFVAAYKAKYGSEPNNYAAEGYDATWFIARALKQANSTDRAKVHAAMATVAQQGFEGAMGKLTFEGTDLRVPGTMAMWTGSGETVVNLS